MIYIMIRLFILLSVFTFFMVGAEVKSEAQQAGVSEITSISVEEEEGTTRILIEGSAPLSYTVYKPADPYRVVVELQEVELGQFKDKIVIDRAGVMEIIPSKIEHAAKLEIILTVPAEIKPVQKENALILSFYNPESEEEPALLAEEAEEIEKVLGDAEIIENIELSKSKDTVRVVISGDGKMYPKVFEADGNKLIVDIPDVSTLVDSFTTYEPPVMGVRIGEYTDKTRLVFDLLDSTKYDISEEGNQVIFSFEVPEVKAAITTLPVSEEEVPQVVTSELKPFKSKKYVGEKISIDFQDAELLHIFRLLADVSGYNIVVSPDVKGRFSMKLTNVPWDHALDIILRNYGLSKAVEDNIIRIAPTDKLAREEEEIARAKEAAEKAGDLVTKIYPVNYADVKKIKKAIEDAKILTKRGYVSTDERTSTVIIKDVEDKHKEYQRLIESLDKATPQVSVEAKIVEVTTSFTRELGIQWGFLWEPTPQMQIGGTDLAENQGFFSGNPYLVDLPAPVGSGSGGSIGFGYISASDLKSLDVQLSAMETSGNGRIVSNPKIITLDNKEATIQQGKKIPYQTVSAEGTQTEFVDANIELTVTPHITPQGAIVMKIETKKNEADFSQTVGGVPTIDTKEATTELLVKDGDTVVLGGIFKANVSKSKDSVPWLGDIPVLGWLFKTEQDIDNTTELLIFITPRVILSE